MFVIIGGIVVTLSVVAVSLKKKGNPGALLQIAEFVVICGCAGGALVIMAPKKVFLDLVRLVVLSFTGAAHSRSAYEELLKALYELFLLGRRNGMIALEEHVMNPEQSSVFTKYPSFIHNRAAVRFLCGALRPIIDGKIKPDQLRVLMDVEMETMETEHHAPISVLTKAADAMPG